MISRRSFLLGATALVAAPALPEIAQTCTAVVDIESQPMSLLFQHADAREAMLALFTQDNGILKQMRFVGTDELRV